MHKELECVKESDEEKLKEIKERYKSARSAQCHIEHETALSIWRQIRKLERLNVLQRASIAPIRWVPPEILVNIFKYYVYLDESPVILMDVCPLWEKLAWSTPSLWGRIRFSQVTRTMHIRAHFKVYEPVPEYHFGGNIGTLRILNGYLMCSNEHEINEAIAHSGPRTPLDLYVELSSSSNVRKLSRFLISVLGKSVGHRIWRLKFEMPFFDDDLSTKVFDACIADSYPALTSLSTDIRIKSWAKLMLPRLMMDMSNPESLEMNNRAVTALPPNKDWSQLHTLQFSPDTMPSELDSICGSLKSLKKIKGIPVGWPHMETPQATFDQILEISLHSSYHFLHKVSLLGLHHLGLSIFDSNNDPPHWIESSWNLPLLRILQLRIHSKAFSSWFLSLSLPSLRHFEVYCGENMVEKDFPPITFPEVEKVKIEGHGSSEWIIGCLRNTPNVLDIILDPAQVDVESIQTLLKLLDDSKLCKQVKELTIAAESQVFPVDDREILSPLIQRVAAAHSEARFYIGWEDSRRKRRFVNHSLNA